MTRILLTVVALLLGVGACVAMAVYRGRAPVVTTAEVEETAPISEPTEPEPARPEWLTVVVPASEVAVSAPVPARIAAVLVNLGDVVEAGQPIARLDPDVARRALAEARAQLGARVAERKQAEAVRAQKRDKVDRISRLGTLIAEAERAEAELAAEGARADVERASAEIRVQRVLIAELEDKLRDTTIRAPLAGEVTARLLDAGAQVDAGEAIVRVVEHARRIRFAVGVDAAPPAVGSVVQLRCADERARTAVVTHVAPDIDPATRVVLVEAEPEDPHGLRLGETCSTTP